MSTAFATEDILIIETPERVPLHFALASIGNRFLACAIDHALQAVVIVLMAAASSGIASYSTLGEKLTNAPKWVYVLLNSGSVFDRVRLFRLFRMDLAGSNAREALAEVARDS